MKIYEVTFKNSDAETLTVNVPTTNIHTGIGQAVRNVNFQFKSEVVTHADVVSVTVKDIVGWKPAK